MCESSTAPLPRLQRTEGTVLRRACPPVRPARQSLPMPVVSPERPHVEYWPGVAARLLKVGSVEPQGRGEEGLQRWALVSRVDIPVEVEWAALGRGDGMGSPRWW